MESVLVIVIGNRKGMRKLCFRCLCRKLEGHNKGRAR